MRAEGSRRILLGHPSHLRLSERRWHGDRALARPEAEAVMAEVVAMVVAVTAEVTAVEAVMVAVEAAEV